VAISNPRRSQPPQVTAVFGDSFQTFALKHGATLADLAARIDPIGAGQDGAPLAVRIQFGGPTSLGAAIASKLFGSFH
jgi:hypothetical protein